MNHERTERTGATGKGGLIRRRRGAEAVSFPAAALPGAMPGIRAEGGGDAADGCPVQAAEIQRSAS